MRILVTGAAGFIGSHLCRQLITNQHQVVGIDNLNDYYDVELKKNRVKWVHELGDFKFIQEDICSTHLSQLFEQHHFDKVVNLAAQAGVRYSLENPRAYIDANIVGFANILELCRQHHVKHLIYASSSSVYGGNQKLPFAETDPVDRPLSLYAASKKSNELMAHCYAHLYHLPVTGLRFFTVYGPWGRPDMALFKFVEQIVNDKPIPLFNHGNMMRDFTYIEDIIEGVTRIVEQEMPANQQIPYQIYNIGHNQPMPLQSFVREIENALGKKAKVESLPMQPGDVKSTHADMSKLMNDYQYKPGVSIQKGVGAFVDWYKQYYQI